MMPRAANWNEFLDGARNFHSPQQNMVYADVDGNIGFVAAGRVPIRRADNDLFGMAPAPGWDRALRLAGLHSVRRIAARVQSAQRADS